MKIKRNVAIALIIFIFIVGNIIVFGSLQPVQSKGTLIKDISKDTVSSQTGQSNIQSTSNTNTTDSKNTQTSSASQASSTQSTTSATASAQTQAPTPAPAPIIQRRMIVRTRAS